MPELSGRRRIGVLSFRFRAVTMANGNFSFEMPGIAGQKFLIESSDDLVNWTEALTGTIGDTGVIPFTNIGSTEGQKFFRARVLP